MTAAEALQLIRGLASANRYIVSSHAWLRANQRGAGVQDIRHGLVNANSCSWQPERETWRVETCDLDGDDLTLVVSIQEDLIVVTLF